MANMASETLSKANGIAPDIKNKAVMAENHLEKMAFDAGDKIGSVASQLADSTAEYVKTGRQYVKENPAKGVAIAAAAGVVAGSLLTLAFRRKQ